MELYPTLEIGRASRRTASYLAHAAIPIQFSQEDFDQVAYDVTNFLVYVAEPMAAQRKQIGVGVLIFLGILFVFAWLLNREYWRDIH